MSSAYENAMSDLQANNYTQMYPVTRSNADLNQRDALQMLDALEEFQYSESSMLAELRFNFGYTDEQAGAVYREWIRRV